MQSASIFEPSVDADFDILMSWFANARDVGRWGGPEFEFPYTAASFRRDCHWPGMASYSLRDPGNGLVAFGQFYDRGGYINLARIGVRPGLRGEGIGRFFMTRLMAVGRETLQLPAYSLYVYRDNEAALRCYQGLGFDVKPYPSGEKLADVCYYMTRPVTDDAGEDDNNKKTEGENR